MVLDIDKVPPPQPSAATKWLVGSACAVVVILSIIVSIYCPALQPVMGALSGAAMDIFFQVVVNNTMVDDINWTRVIISAAMGAISAGVSMAIGPLNNFGTILLDTAIDGFLGGIENAVITYVEGGNLQEVSQAYGEGFLYGMAISGVFKIAGAAIKGVAKGCSKLVKNISNKIKINKSLLSGAVEEGAENTLKKSKNALKEVADDTATSATTAARVGVKRAKDLGLNADFDESVPNSVKKKVLKAQKKLADKSIKEMSLDAIDIETGKVIDPKLKFDYYKSKPDGIIAKVVDGDDVGYYYKKNGCVSLVAELKPGHYVQIDGFTGNRTGNLSAAMKKFREMWADNPDLIPDKIKKDLIDDFGNSRSLKEIMQSLSNDDLEDYIARHFRRHELADMKTIQLIPKGLHEKAKHYGGRKLAEVIESMFGKDLLQKYLSFAKPIV